eukprot:5147121-Prymnesium_polylepis.1
MARPLFASIDSTASAPPSPRLESSLCKAFSLAASIEKPPADRQEDTSASNVTNEEETGLIFSYCGGFYAGYGLYGQYLAHDSPPRAATKETIHRRAQSEEESLVAAVDAAVTALEAGRKALRESKGRQNGMHNEKDGVHDESVLSKMAARFASSQCVPWSLQVEYKKFECAGCGGRLA